MTPSTHPTSFRHLSAQSQIGVILPIIRLTIMGKRHSYRMLYRMCERQIIASELTSKTQLSLTRSPNLNHRFEVMVVIWISKLRTKSSWRISWLSKRSMLRIWAKLPFSSKISRISAKGHQTQMQRVRNCSFRTPYTSKSHSMLSVGTYNRRKRHIDSRPNRL